VRAALNSVEAVTTVGIGSSGYQIGFDLFEFFEDFQFVAGTQDYYDDEWTEDTKVLTQPVNFASWADFTEVLAAPVAPVPATGQTESTAAGDDGDLQKGVPWPDQRFTDNADGTVTDNLTGLVWLQNAGCFAGVNSLLWAEAIEASNEMGAGQCGLIDGSEAGDWRLPNVREQLSLIDYGVTTSPPLPAGHPFLNAPSEPTQYWTSTSQIGWNEFAYAMEIQSGEIGVQNKTTKRISLWPVRGGN
jgi:hypothetical protein